MSPQSSVRAHDVFCLYPTPRGHVAALRGLTLDVATGERVVVHGPNGSGKTTLLRVLTGERAPSAGDVVVCGVDLTGVAERDRSTLRRRRLGMVDQHHTRTLRPELPVLDNVALQLRLAGLGRAPARKRAALVLDQLGLGHLGRRRPLSLSGGEAQRIAVCAAVAHGPTLVLADEPTGELDRTAADAVYDLLATATAAAGAALVLVTHDAGATRIADRVVRIRDGRLSEEWTPADAGHETLVIDDRGWVRLPEPLRVQAGLTARARAAVGNRAIVLSAASVPPPSPAGNRAVRPATPGPTAPPETLLDAVGITVDRGGRRILDGQSVRLRQGSLTVVMGRSGSGKTTLLRVLAGLDRPDSGTVRMLGTDLADLDRTALAALRRRHLCLATQSASLVETLDVVENLELVRQIRGLGRAPEVVGTLIDAVGLAGLRHRPVSVLSGGERQRVSVARVLASETPVAVLDEPTSQQDEANAERLVSALQAATRRGTAVVAATHDPVLIAAADTVVTLA